MPQLELDIDTSALDRLGEEFPRLADSIKAEMEREATLAAARVIETAIVAAAPVRADVATPHSTALKPFAVRADIGITELNNRAGWLVGPGRLTAYVVRWLEFGHFLVKGGYLSMKRGKMRGYGHRVGHVPPHPFIRPAFDATAGAAGAAAQQKFADLIRQAFSKLAGKVAKVA